MDGSWFVQGLLDRGYSLPQATAIAGNILQESGGDPTNVNSGEDAHGLLQWRGDRWQGLQDFAKSRGSDVNDPGVQLDYIGQELGGSEKRNAPAFLGAADVGSANSALKKYIRYGDNSEGKRLGYATGLLNSYGGEPAAAAPAAAPAPLSIAPPAQDASTQAASTSVPFPSFAPMAQAAAKTAPQQAAPQFIPLSLVPTRPRVDLAQIFSQQRGS
jgi:hypothetical protein